MTASMPVIKNLGTQKLDDPAQEDDQRRQRVRRRVPQGARPDCAPPDPVSDPSTTYLQTK